MNPAKSTRNEHRSLVMHWPKTGHTHNHTHTHTRNPASMPVAPMPGHLAPGSKPVCCSNQSSQWATPLIQFYFISGEQTTGGVCTFLGSRGPGVILSLNDPRSDSSPSNCFETNFVLLADITARSSRERNKDRHNSFYGHGREVKQN